MGGGISPSLSLVQTVFFRNDEARYEGKNRKVRKFSVLKLRMSQKAKILTVYKKKSQDDKVYVKKPRSCPKRLGVATLLR